jgi:hypothetical protein
VVGGNHPSIIRYLEFNFGLSVHKISYIAKLYKWTMLFTCLSFVHYIYFVTAFAQEKRLITYCTLNRKVCDDYVSLQ